MKKRIFSILTTLIALKASIPLFAQDTEGALLNNPPPEPESAGAKLISPLSRFEFTLSITVLAFGLLIIILEMFLIKSNKINAEDSIKFIVITLIITSTLFLITAGYSNDQIAPAVGLLGTIAGYLLGRIEHPNKKEDKNEKAP